MNAIAKIQRDSAAFAGTSRNVVACVFAERKHTIGRRFELLLKLLPPEQKQVAAVRDLVQHVIDVDACYTKLHPSARAQAAEHSSRVQFCLLHLALRKRPCA